MELVDGDSESPTLISNSEVTQLLKKNLEARSTTKKNDKRKANTSKRNKQFRHRDWVEEEVHKYLETTPCVKLDPTRRKEFYSKLRGNKKMRQRAAVATKQEESTSDEQQQQQQQEMPPVSVSTGYNLTEAEALQIMNTMPAEPVEIHLMVDELQSRMSEERQEEFLGFIASYCKEEVASPDAVTSQVEPMDEDEGDTNHSMGQNGKGHEQENGKLPAVKVKKEAESEQSGVI